MRYLLVQCGGQVNYPVPMGLIFLRFERYTCVVAGRKRATPLVRCDKVLVIFYGGTVLIGCMACSNTVEGADGGDGTAELFLGNRESSGSRPKQRSDGRSAGQVLPRLWIVFRQLAGTIRVRLSIAHTHTHSLSLSHTRARARAHTHTHTHIFSFFSLCTEHNPVLKTDGCADGQGCYRALRLTLFFTRTCYKSTNGFYITSVK